MWDELSICLRTRFLERDEAVLWIEKAREERQPTILIINRHPMYASLRSHPGFQAVFKKLGL